MYGRTAARARGQAARVTRKTIDRCTDAQLARARGQAARATRKTIDKMYARAACACAAGELAAPGETMDTLANP
ncbi:MAG: hypothetical protein QOG23_2117 [Blastocatellia bacterium]|nr:hypothetical protein [Blastocatellia bacterium]